MQLKIIQGTEVGIGMKRYLSPPPFGMLFILGNQPGTVTMQGVRFPLDISFYNINKSRVPIIEIPTDAMRISPYVVRMFPNASNMKIPQGSFYMIEIPSKQ